jgi:hypothetical protein
LDVSENGVYPRLDDKVNGENDGYTKFPEQPI